jgi:tetratricopeptide (TPR) repeat protein
MEERLEQAELDGLWLPGDPRTSADRLALAAAVPERSEVVRAELETQRARALGLQRRFEEAEALLDSLEPAFGRLEVRILAERGRLRAAEGRSADAVVFLEDALLAARREGDAYLAVDAAVSLAEADRARTQQWVEEGFADLADASDPRTLRWGVALHALRGWDLLDAGDAPAALAAFERAEAAAVRYGTDEQRFTARWSVARALRALGRTAAALEIQRALEVERPGDPGVEAELSALTARTPTIET